MSLKDYTDAQLQKELERRKVSRTPPKRLPNPDFTKLVETIETCVRDTEKDNYWDEDFIHHIYEAAIEAVYGHNFWTWVNSLDK